MVPAVFFGLIRRAILDLVEDTGGDLNDEMITLLLNELGHRIARSEVRDQIAWCADNKLLITSEVGAFLVARSTSDGRDVANGLLRFEGVSRHKTGE